MRSWLKSRQIKTFSLLEHWSTQSRKFACSFYISNFVAIQTVLAFAYGFRIRKTKMKNEQSQNMPMYTFFSKHCGFYLHFPNLGNGVFSTCNNYYVYNRTNKNFLWLGFLFFFAKSFFGYKLRKETSFPEELCCRQYFGKMIKIKNTTTKHKHYLT